MKKFTLVSMIMLLFLMLLGCGTQKNANKPYMGNHNWGDKKETVESVGNAEEILGMKVFNWIYLYTTDEILKGEIYQVSDPATVEEVVKVFEGVYGEAKAGYRGDEQNYLEYSWVDDIAKIYVLKKVDEEGIFVQIEKITK